MRAFEANQAGRAYAHPASGRHGTRPQHLARSKAFLARIGRLGILSEIRSAFILYSGLHPTKPSDATAALPCDTRLYKAPELNPVENIWQTACSLLQRRWLVPGYAANEGCAGWSGTEPHA